ncbi:YmdB family metallophosphoesterase [Parvularcula sp. ZS-1/3]|uniref:YmdB family metallophosphoesterase n=1 Tax=Parvularcula mediterranea TaxID=2732508 RepID=A0A7Y3W4I6_9PROT|nr:YmdB family metallophosphoesterase [Parvularcula mediterranea]
MRLLYLGDIMGRSGRSAVIEALPGLRRDLRLDFVIANAENAAGGFGVTESIANDLFAAGVDCITTGNHAFDQANDLHLFENDDRVLRPANFPPSNPGRGAGLYMTRDGYAVLVIQVQGQLFMGTCNDPPPAIERELEGVQLGREADAIIVDVHAEASSEKYSIGHWLDGRVSLVCGSHTHVPTADVQVFPGGTAFQSDAGMCGDYDSCIGMEKTTVVEKYLTKMRGPRMQPAAGPATICGLVVETDPKTGLAISAEPLRVGGRLADHIPA